MNCNRIIITAIAFSIFVIIFLFINTYINGIIKDKTERKMYKKKESLIKQTFFIVGPIFAYPNLIKLLNDTNLESLKSAELVIFVIKLLTFIVLLVFSLFVISHLIKSLKLLKRYYEL